MNTFPTLLVARLAEARERRANVNPQVLLKQAKKAGFFNARYDPAFVTLDRAATKLRIVADAALCSCTIMTFASLREVITDQVDLEEAGCFSLLDAQAFYRGQLRPLKDHFHLTAGMPEPTYTIDDAFTDLSAFSRLGKFDRASLESFLVQQHNVGAVGELGILVGSVPLLASTASSIAANVKRKCRSAKRKAETMALAEATKTFNRIKRDADVDKLFCQILESHKATLPQDHDQLSQFCLRLLRRLQQCLGDGTATPQMLGLARERNELLCTTNSVCQRLGIARDCSLEQLARLEEEVLLSLREASFESLNDSRGFLDFLRAEASLIWPDDPTAGENCVIADVALLEAAVFVDARLPDWLLRDLSEASSDAEVIFEVALHLGIWDVDTIPKRSTVVSIIAERLAKIDPETPLRTVCVSDLRAKALDQWQRGKSHLSLADAMAAIQRVPYLADIAEATGWSRVFKTVHGPLRDFVARNFRFTAHAFTAAGGGLVRLDPKPSLAVLRTALEEDSPMEAAVAVLSLIHKRTATAEIILALRDTIHTQTEAETLALAHGLLQFLPCAEHRLLMFNLLSHALNARFSCLELLEELFDRDIMLPRGILASMAALDESLAPHFQIITDEAAAAQGQTVSSQSAPLLSALPTTTPGGGVVPAPGKVDPTSALSIAVSADGNSPQAVVMRARQKWSSDADETMDPVTKAKMQHLEEKLSGMIGMASEDIYGSSDRFLMELVQNADDNIYAEGETPTLTLRVLPTGLLLHNNEVGFTEQNVVSICDIQKSSKANKAGFIGEKGIGFKAVFKVSHAPEIHSNGFHFAFDTIENPRLGYVCPVWKDEPSPEAAYLVDAEVGGTVLYLPWHPTEKDRKWKRLAERELRDISSTVVLFLSTLEVIKACDDKGGVVRELVKTIEQQDSTTGTDGSGVLSVASSVVSVREQQGATVQSSRWWIYEEEVSMTSSRNDQQRTKIAMAFPLGEKGLLLPEGPLAVQDVCSFLPMKAFGFSFVLQADFNLVSSREAPKQDDAWNEELLARIPRVLQAAFRYLRDTVCVGTDASDGSHIINRFLEFLSISAREPFITVATSMLSHFQQEHCVPMGSDGSWARPTDVLLAPQLPRDYLPDLQALAAWQDCRLIQGDDSNAAVLARLGARHIDANLLVQTLVSLHHQHDMEDSKILRQLKVCLRLWNGIGAPCQLLRDVPCVAIQRKSAPLAVMTLTEAVEQQVFVRASVSAKEVKKLLKGLSALSSQLLFVHDSLTDDVQVCRVLANCQLATFSPSDMLDSVALPRLLPPPDFDPKEDQWVFVDAQILASKLSGKGAAAASRLQTCELLRRREDLLWTTAGKLVPPCSISRKKTFYTHKSSHFLAQRYRTVAKAAGVDLTVFLEAFLVPHTFSLLRDSASNSFWSAELQQFAEWCDGQDSAGLEKAIRPTKVNEDWKTAYRLFQHESTFAKQLLESRWYVCDIGTTLQVFSLAELCELDEVQSVLQIESRATVERLFPCRNPALMRPLQPQRSPLSLEFFLDLVTNRWAAMGAINSGLWEETPNSLSAGIAPLAAAVYHRIFALVEATGFERDVVEMVRERMASKSILRVATHGASVSFVAPSAAFIADKLRLVEDLGSGSMVLLRYYTERLVDLPHGRLMSFFQDVLGVRTQPSVAEYASLVSGTIHTEQYSSHLRELLCQLPHLNISSVDREALGDLQLPCTDGSTRLPADCCWASWAHPSLHWDNCPMGILDLGGDLTQAQQESIARALMVPPIEECMSVAIVEGPLSTGLLPQRAMAWMLPLMQRYLCKTLPGDQYFAIDTAVKTTLAGGVDVMVLGDKDTSMRVEVTCQGKSSPSLPCQALFVRSSGSAATGGKLYTCSYYVELRHEFKAMFATFLRAFGVLDECAISECATTVTNLSKEIGVHLDEQRAVDTCVASLDLPTIPAGQEWSLGADDSLVVVRSRKARATPSSDPSPSDDGASEKNLQAASALVEKLTARGVAFQEKLAAAPTVEQTPSALPGRGYTAALPQSDEQHRETGSESDGANRTCSDAHRGGTPPSATDGGHIGGGPTAPSSFGHPSGTRFHGDMLDGSLVSGQALAFEAFNASSEALDLMLAVGANSDEELDAKVGRIGEEVASLWLKANGYRQVEWLNREAETGLPYDLTCISPQGNPLKVEVKSTRCSAEEEKAKLFVLSPNEAALLWREDYALLRVCSALSPARQVCMLSSTLAALGSGKLHLWGLLNAS